MADRAVGEERLFEAVSREPKLSDKVAKMMLQTILERRLKPGDRLPSEQKLCEQFGVSRTVIREALSSLAARGIIEVRSGSGLRVAAVDPSAVRESMRLFLHGGRLEYWKVHDVRAGLEVHMAAAAAERRKDEDVRDLTAICELMEASIDDVATAAKHDLEFHRLIALSTGNELFLILLDSIGDALLEVRRENLADTTEGSATVQAHREILTCIAEQDAEGAREAMRRHLEGVKAAWSRRAGVNSDGDAGKHRS